jgi:hypothetical protein
MAAIQKGCDLQVNQSSNPLHTGETDKLMSSSVRFVGLAYQGKDIVFRFMIE